MSEKTRTFKFANGEPVKEIITGFSGTITGTAFYLTGCNTYLVTAKPKDEYSEGIALWYDEGRLQSLGSPIFTKEDVAAEENGCDRLPNHGKKGN